MLKKAALAIGIVLLVLGVAGFIPGITTGSGDLQKLFGLFMVNSWHNWVHIITGVAFLAASANRPAACLVFQLMALVYGVVTIVGFIIGSGNEVFGFIMINTWDNFLHLVLTLVFVVFGFVVTDKMAPAADAASSAG